MQLQGDHPMPWSRSRAGHLAVAGVDGDLGPGGTRQGEAQPLPGRQGGCQGLQLQAQLLPLTAVLPPQAQEAGGNLTYPGAIGAHHRQGAAEVKSWLVRRHPQFEPRTAQQIQAGRQGFAAEAGHIGPPINVAALHQAGIQAQVAPPTRDRAPGVMHHHHHSLPWRQRRLPSLGGGRHQPPLQRTHRRQPSTLQTPAQGDGGGREGPGLPEAAAQVLEQHRIGADRSGLVRAAPGHAPTRGRRRGGWQRGWW